MGEALLGGDPDARIGIRQSRPLTDGSASLKSAESPNRVATHEGRGVPLGRPLQDGTTSAQVPQHDAGVAEKPFPACPPQWTTCE